MERQSGVEQPLRLDQGLVGPPPHTFRLARDAKRAARQRSPKGVAGTGITRATTRVSVAIALRPIHHTTIVVLRGGYGW
jgi:hypothetical protein